MAVGFCAEVVLQGQCDNCDKQHLKAEASCFFVKMLISLNQSTSLKRLRQVVARPAQRASLCQKSLAFIPAISEPAVSQE